MNRKPVIVIAAAIGVLVGAVGIGAATTGAFAASSPAPGARVAGVVAQATATPTPSAGWSCPFLNADGSFDLGAMDEWMDQVHGEGAFEQMWSWMTGGGNADGTGASATPAAGVGPGAGWHGGMMGGWFGGPSR